MAPLELHPGDATGERRAGDAAAAVARLREGAGRGVAGERDERAGEGTGDVEAGAVAADRHPLRGAEGDAGGAAGDRFGDAAGRVPRLGEGAAGAVAIEDRDGVAEERADVEIGSVGADHDHVGTDQRPAGGADGHGQSGDAAGAGGSWVRAPVERLR